MQNADTRATAANCTYQERIMRRKGEGEGEGKGARSTHAVD